MQQTFGAYKLPGLQVDTINCVLAQLRDAKVWKVSVFTNRNSFTCLFACNPTSDSGRLYFTPRTYSWIILVKSNDWPSAPKDFFHKILTNTTNLRPYVNCRFHPRASAYIILTKLSLRRRLVRSKFLPICFRMVDGLNCVCQISFLERHLMKACYAYLLVIYSSQTL